MVKPLINKTGRPTALVAGGAGFLGSHLVERLLESDVRVIIVDSFSPPPSTHPWCTAIQFDLSHGTPPEVEGVEYIFHLVGGVATYHLLELARRSQAKFLLISSIDVSRGFPQVEAQRYAESLVWDYSKRFALDVRIVRLGKVYGPQMDFQSGGALGRLLQQLVAGEALTVYGDGLDKDYYCFVEDGVRGVVQAMFGEETMGKVFPVADPTPLTSLELAYLLQRKFNPATQVVFKPPRPRGVAGPPTQAGGSGLDPISLDTSLGWEPQVSLEVGVEKVLANPAPPPAPPAPPVGAVSPPAQAGLQADPPLTTPSVAARPQPPTPRRRKKPTPRALRAPYLPEMPRPPETAKVRWGSMRLEIPFPRRLLTWLGVGVALIPVWLGVVGPMMQLAYHSWQAYRLVEEISGGENLIQLATDSQAHLRQVEYYLDSLAWLAGLLGRGDNLRATHQFVVAASLVAGVAGDLGGVLPPLSERMLAINPAYPQLEADVETESRRLALSLESAQNKLNLAEAELQLVQEESLPQLLIPSFELLREQLPELRQGVGVLQAGVISLPKMLGFAAPQTYLVLFQNSHELRPTGGFIGSYALVTLEEGRLRNLKIDDIYNPDGLLEEKGVRIVPPLTLEKYLGVDALFIRDANWWVDFPTSAERVEELLAIATGGEVQGVWAVDLELVQQMLEVVGPIYLALYEETITAENLYERAEFHSEVGFFAGSPRKKNFLSALGEKLLDRLFRLDEEAYPVLLRKLAVGLKEKHLLVYFHPGELARVFAEQGWDGRVKQESGDFLMVVDANVGSTKANYYVQRAIQYTVEEANREGELRAQLTLTYTHIGVSNAWPGGPYKAFTRVLTPNKTSLVKVTRSTEGVEGKALDITGAVEIGEESGKITFGIPFTLQAGKGISFVFEYILPPEVAGLGTPRSSVYKLLVQKQPGTHADPLVFELIAPFGRRVSYATGDGKVSPTLVRWVGDLKEDVEIEVGLE